MNPSDYLESLILGQENSSIPVQTSELRLLKKFMEMERKDARELLTNTRNRLLADNMYRNLISEIDTWLNTQFYNIIAAIASAEDVLHQATIVANRHEADRVLAIKKVNELQEKFDELVQSVKDSAIESTNWKRYG